MSLLPDTYDHRLAAAGVRDRAFPYCHRWASLWTKADGPASPERTQAFFDALGRSTGIAEWQFHQALQAVHILAHDALALPWAADFPWDSLADQTRGLPPSHRTLLRESHPVTAYIQFLALERQVSSSTQKQALNALVFLLRHILGHAEFTLDLDPPTAGRRRPPTVLTREEVRTVLGFLDAPWKLAAQLLYGSGLRIMEALRLRVKDIDFGHGTITIHDAKGGKHRLVPLPKALESRLQAHLATNREKHRLDLITGVGEVHMDASLARKYPNAPREWPWQFVFPAAKLCPHPRTGEFARYHLHEDSLQRQVRDAVRKADIPKRASCHTFRHSFATHLLQSGTDIRTLQSLLGHSSVETTMVYLHLLDRPGAGAPSPLDL